MIRIAPMKRITQLVALVVALLVAGQLAMAEGPCSMRLQSGNDHDPTCCMKAAGAAQPKPSAGCHGAMQSHSTASQWNQGGCQAAPAQVFAATISKTSSTVSKPQASAFVAQVPAIPLAVFTAGSLQGMPAPGPARYLLLQVFKI
jgi:hypothetical protein